MPHGPQCLKINDTLLWNGNLKFISELNLSWLGEVKWRHRQRPMSQLTQVTVCCLLAPSHCLNRCWLTIYNFSHAVWYALFWVVICWMCFITHGVSVCWYYMLYTSCVSMLIYIYIYIYMLCTSSNLNVLSMCYLPHGGLNALNVLYVISGLSVLNVSYASLGVSVLNRYSAWRHGQHWLR